ncbi:MAG: hypothetical protein HOG49_01045 [Candidatus Scalindua sp.]|jgi:hypothetical protein|nr:hypothetical protein [Candidatus Scalindua sp.]
MVRLTQTEKWVKKWFRNLPPTHKLLFIYLTEACNNAGFYEVDTENICYFTKLSEEEVGEILQSSSFKKDVVVKDEWLWIKDFLVHQKNFPLNDNNNAHKQIIRQINEQKKRFPMSQALVGKKVVEKASKIPTEGKTPFESVWSLYDKKVGSNERLRNKWNKLSIETQDAIMKHIPQYKQSQPSKQYRKNFETYLNQESWNDEIISTEVGGQPQKKYERLI